MVRPYSRENGDDSTDSSLDTTHIIAGCFSFFVLVLMCLTIAYLSAKRKRRIARETEADRARAQEDAIHRLIRRKKEAEDTILTLTLDSDCNGAANSNPDQDRSTTLVQSPPSSPSNSSRQIAAVQVSTGTECQICFQDFAYGNIVAFSHNPRCIHIFHKECIVDWLARDDRCPSCRRDYLKNGEEEETDDANVIATNLVNIEEGGNTIIAQNRSTDVQVLSQGSRSEIMVQDANSSTMTSDSIGDNQMGDHVESLNESAIDIISVHESYASLIEDDDECIAAQFPISTPDDSSFDEVTTFVA